MIQLRKSTVTQELFILHSHKVDGIQLRLVYKLSTPALKKLTRKGYKPGKTVPKPLFLELLNCDSIFMPENKEDFLTEDEEEQLNDEDEDEIGSGNMFFSGETSKWFTTRLEKFPGVKIKVTDCKDGSKDVQFTGLPDNYVVWLTAVAHLVDGTDFLDQLDASYGYLRAVGRLEGQKTSRNKG